ncbi:heme biosynthesis HemY N-terminal domain-containing protein [Thalassotalea profundi]|uniref:Porphyrin biosynthesis protein n=1 Tax=Thalassotalea profundi TaxID=2036687 RepID=A0ABQ3IQ80_9GAMM|nr:heme biosynthesis HemY N-terminal domain-containing protein [Thalassotalea profundi]GHE88539.1 porphyrin biosynthesis protein [Thalassotalea profundi]
MKKIVVLILLFFAAVAISPLLINEKGYILIAMGDLTVESTVVTAIIMLVLIFIGLMLSIKVFRGGLKLTFGTWNKIAFASRRRAIRDFNKGIACYILEDNQQAEHLLSKCAEPSQQAQLCYLLAASAANKQGLATNSKHYLALLNEQEISTKELGLETVLVTVKLLINYKEYNKARELIDEHHKHIGHDDRLLALDINLSLIEQRFEYVVKQLAAARKSKTLEQSKVQLWEAQAFTGMFNQQIEQKSNHALHEYWEALPRKIKQREAVLLAYCQILAQHKINEPLTKILLPVIKKGANHYLLKQIRLLPLSATNELMQAVQKHLHHEPSNAKWLSCLAHLAIADQDWDRAEKAFNSLVNLEGNQYDNVDLQSFAKVLEQKGQLEKAIQVLNKLVKYNESAC